MSSRKQVFLRSINCYESLCIQLGCILKWWGRKHWGKSVRIGVTGKRFPLWECLGASVCVEWGLRDRCRQITGAISWRGGRFRVFDLSASWPVNTQHSSSKGDTNTRVDSNIPGASVTVPHNKQEALELNTLPVFRFSNLNLSNSDGWRWRKQSSTSRCGSKASTSRSHFQRSLASIFVLLLASHLSRLVCFQLGGSSGWWPEKQ